MQDEADLVRQVLAGADCYEALVKRYHVGLIIHCERMVGDRSDAEDIAQEAFVKAYLQLDKFDPSKAGFSTWLYRIATNLTIDFLRKQKRKVSVEEIEAVAEVTMPTYLDDEQKQEIRAAVERLKPLGYRQVVEAYYWDGKNYQEIASELHIPLNTVRTWLRRAKIRLQEELS